ncbi:ABC transporter ATP-binding protein [Mesorhizobium sp. Z1-4]|uniref:ABC transporter ATP-binding protein n=1 Tax=Mesorhizobium sp. Z1-4 TaxID=2448478 RepID=UPI0032AF63A0
MNAIASIPGKSQIEDPIVRFSGVRKSYDGETLVVRDLNLDIVRGEFLTLLGPSGSGKTTSLMMLAGFEAPTEGTISIDGKDVTALPPHRRGIGVVFQNYALFPHMTIGQNVGYPLRVRGTAQAEIDKRVMEALEMVELGAFGDRRPAQLSGGQQQRAALARALVFRPDLVLLDEPLGALDKQLREQMQYELKRLHEELKVTMVYVTHDQTEALTMSDRIAVFNDGRIQQLARPADLYENPQNAFVAEFVGENNRLSGTVTGVSANSVQIDVGGGAVVKARTAGSFSKGDKAVLSLRPERVAVAQTGKWENDFTVEIDKVVYLGDINRLLLRFAGGSEFAVRVANVGSGPVYKRGDSVRVAWRQADCLAFPA